MFYDANTCFTARVGVELAVKSQDLVFVHL